RSARGRESFQSAEVWPDSSGEHDRTVRLLPVFQDGDHGTPDRQAAAVQRVHEARLLLRSRPEADLRTARLEIRERRARADLAVRLLARQPDLQVVRLLRGEPQVARAKRNHPVVEAQPTQRLLRIVDELLERIERALGLLEP